MAARANNGPFPCIVLLCPVEVCFSLTSRGRGACGSGKGGGCRGGGVRKKGKGGPSAAFARRVGLQGIPRASLNRPATPGAPPILVSLLFLSTCRNYEVSDERTHRIAIQAELLEDILSQMTCIKHRRFYDVARRQR